MRNRREYIGQIFDGLKANLANEEVVESIEHEDGPGELSELVVHPNNEDDHLAETYLSGSRGYQQESVSYRATSIGSEYAEIEDTEIEPSFLEDTSILIQNHSPFNPFLVNMTPRTQFGRRPETPFVVHPMSQSVRASEHPSDDTPHLALNGSTTHISDASLNLRTWWSEVDSVDEEVDVVSERDDNSETSIVTQIRIQESIRMDTGSEDTLGMGEDTLMF